MRRSFQKILIANRGEIAVRIIRTVHQMGKKAVAVYSEIDRRALHVRLADESYLIGGASSLESYLNQDAILDVAIRAHVDAIHPGYGFLAENAEFAKAVSERGFAFIGPPSEVIHLMGDKTVARKLMLRAGVPVVPGTIEPLEADDRAVEAAREIGYPVLVKAAAGGGGKGMRIVRKPDELLDAMRTAKSEAQSAFGDSRIYLEKYLEKPRHVEMQILSDAYGNAIYLGERECSIQRRHQKIIEESPSALLDESSRRKMGETAIKAVKGCEYVNAGTVEFLVDANRNFYFLEMNTRLQVEHPVTELVTGIDLVKMQILIAQGEPLPIRQDEITYSGHAIEARIYAEDPLNSFFPSTGIIERFRAPGGPWIRIDSGVTEESEVSVYYDPLIAKLIAWGKEREEARRRLVQALEEFEITGIQHNIPALLSILNHPKFVAGEINTHFIQDYLQTEELLKGDLTEEELVAAAIAAARLRNGQEVSQSAFEQRLAQSPVGEVNRRRWLQKRYENLRG